MPAICGFREFATGGRPDELWGQYYRCLPIGVYTGWVLKREKPADLPVQQATKVELIINLRIANALALTVPLPMLGRADVVIE